MMSPASLKKMPSLHIGSSATRPTALHTHPTNNHHHNNSSSASSGSSREKQKTNKANNLETDNESSKKFLCLYIWSSVIVSSVLVATLAVVIALGAVSSKSPTSCHMLENESSDLSIASLLYDTLRINETFVMTRHMFSKGEFVIDRLNVSNVGIENFYSSDVLIDNLFSKYNTRRVGSIQLRTWHLPASIDFVWNDGRGVSIGSGSYFALSTQLSIGTCDQSQNQNQTNYIFGGSIEQSTNGSIRTYYIKDSTSTIRAYMQQRTEYISYEMPIVRADNSSSIIASLQKNLYYPQEQWVLVIKEPLSKEEMTNGFGYSSMFYLVSYMTFRDK